MNAQKPTWWRIWSAEESDCCSPTPSNSPACELNYPAHCTREPCGDRYLDVVVNRSAGRLHGCAVPCCGLQEAGAVSVLGAGAAELRQEAGHPVQGDGSFCAAQGKETPRQGLGGAGWVTESGTGPPIPGRFLLVSTRGLVPGCLSPRATLRCSAPHAGDEAAQPGALMMTRRPWVQQGEVRVHAEVPFKG